MDGLILILFLVVMGIFAYQDSEHKHELEVEKLREKPCLESKP